jgi:hypothetical protein
MYLRGKKAMEEFGSIDLSTVIYSEKRASGYSLKSRVTKFGGAGKTLHIIVTNIELIVKTNQFSAGTAKRFDLLHRIAFGNITAATIKKGTFKSKLHICFTSENGEAKEIVIMSKGIERIKELLDLKMTSQ